MRRPWTVALTGGIASGKTTLAALLAGHRIPVVDSDQISREITLPNEPGDRRLRENLEREFFDADGRLDRRRLRLAMTEDPGLRRCVETLLHPLIWERLESEIASYPAADWLLCVIPLLTEIEPPPSLTLDRVLVVDCREGLQVGRLMVRDQMERAEAERLLALQSGRETRLRRADDLVVNESGLGELAESARELVDTYTQRARNRPLEPSDADAGPPD
jgi:dephospho-CoA kinase